MGHGFRRPHSSYRIRSTRIVLRSNISFRLDILVASKVVSAIGLSTTSRERSTRHGATSPLQRSSGSSRIRRPLACFSPSSSLAATSICPIRCHSAATTVSRNWVSSTARAESPDARNRRSDLSRRATSTGSLGWDCVRSLPILPRIGDAPAVPGLGEVRTPFVFEQVRERISYVSSRIVRDRIFRQTVLRAYDQRCAITGLRLINGGGRAEVDAAHIRPVEQNGPDIVSNGLALSGTAHWMFDRGLISLSDDLEVLISTRVNDPESVRGLITKSGYARPPLRSVERPHPHFLRWHREHCFKQ